MRAETSVQSKSRQPRALLAGERRSAAVELVIDRQHYDSVVAGAIRGSRVSVWVATANLKDVHIEAPIGSRARARGRYLSIIEEFADLVRRGVEIRLLHAGVPSRPFSASLHKSDLKAPGFQLRRCPRVHMKLVVVDGAYLYLGSANFTGAGLGAKSDERRNFEIGIATDDHLMLDMAQSRFDRIWSGRECGSCRLRAECPKPLDAARATRRRG